MVEVSTSVLDALMGSAVDAPLSTQIIQPLDGEYTLMIADGDPRKWVTALEIKKEGSRMYGQTRYIFRVPCVIQDETAKIRCKREKVMADFDIWLDMNSDGTLATKEGENIDLGRLFAAIGKNTGGMNLMSLPGAGPFKGKLVVDKQDNGREYAKIKSVAAIA